MNKVILVGRVVRDPEIRYSQGENATAVARFSLAVNRRFKNSEGNYDADFPNCVAYGKTAEFIEKYFKKGSAIGVVGRIQTGSYTNKDGVKVYTTDIVVEEAEFVESRTPNDSAATTSQSKPTADTFQNIPDGVDEALPFA